MAAVQALLSAAGVLKHNKKLLKKSTATEHATSSSSTATEHATSRLHLALLQSIQSPPDPAASTDDVSRLPLTGLPMSTSKLQASASEDGYLLGDNDLEKIVALLLWMAQDFQSNISKDDIHCAALDLIIKHSGATGGALGLLHTASAEKLSKLIDIMMLHKDGSAKDANATLHFMRRTAKIREEVLATVSDNATERVELSEADVSSCYRRFGRMLLANDLLPDQKQNPKYRLQNKFEGDTSLTGFQRSFTDHMLRKFLGDKKVATVIFQHGIPSVADNSVVYPRRVYSMGMLQSGLEECLQWYTNLANEIVVYQNQEGFDAQLSASSLDERERQRQQTRREALQKARDALRLGAALAKQRDNHKRSYDEMDEAEQKILEDFETGKAKKAMQSFTSPRLKPFRCRFWRQNL